MFNVFNTFFKYIGRVKKEGIVVTEHFNKYNVGASDFVTCGKQLATIASRMPNRTALIHALKNGTDRSITWKQLHDISNRLAWFLIYKGVGPGSRVIVAFPNNISHIIAAYAIWKTGACYIPISDRTPFEEFAEIWRQVKPRAIFSSCNVDCQPPPDVLHLSEENISGEVCSFPDTLPPDINAVPNMISLSGGTTGKLKLLQQNMPAGMNDEGLKNWFTITGQNYEQIQLVTGPLFHGAPHSSAFNALFAASTVVFSESLRPENVVKCIKKYKVESLQIVPTLMYRIIKIPGLNKEDFSSLKAVYHTGGYCSPFLKQAWIDLVGAEKIYELYSMSECIGMVFNRGDEWLKHPGSLGRIQSGLISIRDENFNELPPHQVGEIYMYSPDSSLNITYLNRDQLEVKPGGFKSVGDMGYVDEDGYLYFVDRRSDMIVTGGENVFASEVENVLIMHPDVIDAVVIGVPDEEWGRRVHAIVEAKRKIPEQEMREFMGRYLAPYKIPRSFEFVKLMPRKENGKINRAELARLSAEGKLVPVI